MYYLDGGWRRQALVYFDNSQGSSANVAAGRCLPGVSRVSSWAATLKYNDYDDLRIWEIVILLLTGLASSAENMVHRVAGSMHGLYIYRVVTTEEGGREDGMDGVGRGGVRAGRGGGILSSAADTSRQPRPGGNQSSSSSKRSRRTASVSEASVTALSAACIWAATSSA